MKELNSKKFLHHVKKIKIKFTNYYKSTYHLVLVIKYRREVINQDIFDFLMDIFLRYW